MRVTLRKVYMILLLAGLIGCNIDKFDPKNPDTYPVYIGSDLGLNYSPKKSEFKVWAPTARKVILRTYANGNGGEALQTLEMKKTGKAVWQLEIQEDLLGQYYTFQAKINKKWYKEVPGPYAKATGANGNRALIVAPNTIAPKGWEADASPELKNISDIILYELHIRDFSNHTNSGMQNKGKYLAFTENGTLTPGGNKSGIDHLKELGITHVHLLPTFDYRSIDELKLEENQFNWGYDPQNYNVPEGSYSANPKKGELRILEFKHMVQAIHKAGIRVVMDVVYNHVGSTQQNSFDQLVPGYYFRYNKDGSFSNASGCGNETASERPMMRKYMIESVKYWAKEYHIDGFRFDLMGIHDIETMNQLAQELKEIDPSIFIYGEGWTAGGSPLAAEEQATKANMPKISNVAAFSDEIRDGIKGHWHDLKTKGFVSGEPNTEESIKFGIVGATQHPQIDYSLVNYSNAYWANEPTQCINYVSCHDNNTLIDKLTISVPDAGEEDKIRMAKLANTIVLTSQGIPFLHAGVEFHRTKQLVENSYNAHDSINNIDWGLKDRHIETVKFYMDLIKMRKEHPGFKLGTTDAIASSVEFMDLDKNMVGYTISGTNTSDDWKEILVVFNANNSARHIDLGPEAWMLGFELDNGYLTKAKNYKNKFMMDGVSAYVFFKN